MPAERPTRISFVCWGNVSRSRLLHHFTERELEANGGAAEVNSLGVLRPSDLNRDTRRILEDKKRGVAARLKRMGLKEGDGELSQSLWSDDSAKKLSESDFVFATDPQTKQKLLEELDAGHHHKVMTVKEYLFPGLDERNQGMIHAWAEPDPDKKLQANFDGMDEARRLAKRLVEKLHAEGRV